MKLKNKTHGFLCDIFFSPQEFKSVSAIFDFANVNIKSAFDGK